MNVGSQSIMFFLIMLGLLVGVPSFAFPAYAANANLFVSAQNSFAGPMVIEVVISDGDINDIDNPHAEPDVTINGKQLRMVQAIDGNWYGYFADKTMAQRADETVGTPMRGLDFGRFCSNMSDGLGAFFTDTDGIAVPRIINGGTDGSSPLQKCDGLPTSPDQINHVVREPKSINMNVNSTGQIGLHQLAWPIIQLYDFTPTGNVVVQYNKGGSVQPTTLTFDTSIQFADITLTDITSVKTAYSKSENIRVTITDPHLNIDPTDEDSWTWSTADAHQGTYYQLFDENGNYDADGTNGAVNLLGDLNNLMLEKNGKVRLVPRSDDKIPFVVNLVDNNDQNLIAESDIMQARTVGNSLQSGTQPMTFVESNQNNGIFRNYDKDGNANLIISSNAQGGTSAAIYYSGIEKIINVEGSSLTVQNISVSTEKHDYRNGESILIFGNVSPVNTSLPASIRVFSSSGYLIYVDQVKVLSTGDYSARITPNEMWDKNEGNFTIMADYNGVTNQTDINYSVIEPDNKRPVAIIDETYDSVEVGNKIKLSAEGSYDPDGTITTYKWKFGDGVSATGKIATHAYEKDGNFHVILTVIDNELATDTEGFFVDVIKLALPIAKISGPSSTQSGAMLILTAYDSYDPDGGSIVQYRWETDEGKVAEGPEVSLAFSSGQHTVLLTVTDDEGNTGQIVKVITGPPSNGNVWVYIAVGGGIGGGAAGYFGIKKIIKPPKPNGKDLIEPATKFWIEVDGGIDK